MKRRRWIWVGGGASAALAVAVGVATNQVLDNGRFSWSWLGAALAVALLTVVLDRILAGREAHVDPRLVPPEAASGKLETHYAGNMASGPDSVAASLRRDHLSSLYAWSTSLLVHLRDRPNTPFQRMEACDWFSWPYILPAADGTAVERLATELQALRREAMRYNTFSYMGPDPGIIGSEQAARTVEEGRHLIREIHGVRVAFLGEQPHANSGSETGSHVTHNWVSGEHRGHIIQAGQISGGVNITTVEAEDDPEVLRDPLEIDTYVTMGSHVGTLIVDADPPRAMAVSGTLYVVTIRARTKLPVILDRARIVVLSRHSPRRACLKPWILGKLEPRKFTTNLDEAQPHLSAEGEDFPFTVRDSDPEQFWFEPVAQQKEVAWRLEIDWSSPGKNHGTAVIDRNGIPFETYPLSALYRNGRGGTRSPLHWDCNDMGPCKPDCPSRRIPPGVLADVYGRV